MNDVHCHFFSEQFFATLGRQRPPGSPQSAADIVAALGWDPPGSPEDLADRWVKELDRAGVARAALIASVPGDEASVARAVARHPSRFVGFFMLDPTAPDAASRTEHALDRLGLRAICLFPAMQRYSLHDPRVKEIVQLAAAHARHRRVRALRRAVGRRSQEARAAEPLRRALRQSPRSSRARRRPSRRAVHHSALRRRPVPRSVARRRPRAKRVPRHVEHESVDVVSPRAHAAGVFRQALEVAGPDRLLFGTDSSFFPRGWNRAVYDAQVSALDAAGVDESVRHRIFTGNFDRLFPA